MPTYPYRCYQDHEFEVVKAMARIDDLEECPTCGTVCGPDCRQIAKTNFTGASDWNTQHWSPALGRVVKNNREAQQIAKQRGLIEVGNEKVETVHKHFEKQREDTRAQRWAEADREKVYGDS